MEANLKTTLYDVVLDPEQERNMFEQFLNKEDAETLTGLILQLDTAGFFELDS